MAAARFLSASRSLIDTLLHTGALPSVKIGRSSLIPIRAVNRPRVVWSGNPTPMGRSRPNKNAADDMAASRKGLHLFFQGVRLMTTITMPPSEAPIPSVDETATNTVGPAAPKPPAPDPFDPAKLRLTQSMTAALGVKKLLTTVPVKKPPKEWFVRTRPEDAYRLETFVIELKEDGETYLVAPEFWDALAGESTFSARLLVTAINRQGTVFLWPIRLPSPDGRHDDWSKSAMEAANIAMRRWVRVQSNMSLGAYEVYEASGNLGDPEWPALPLNELLRIAFKDRYIDSLDHPVLKRLRGEA